MTDWLPNALATNRPAYLAVADAVEAAIAAGGLTAEARLPTVRNLAKHLGLATATVLRGYREAGQRGLIGGTVGKGSFVLASPETHGQASAQFAKRGRVAPGVYDLRSNVVPGPERWSTDPGIQELLPPPGQQRALLASAYTLSQSTEPWEMREAGAAWGRRCGVRAAPDQILVAAGGQHAIAAALCALGAAGSALAVPMMTNSGLLTAARLLGARPVGVRMNEDGMDPSHLDYICRKERPAAIYCAPAGGNPIPTVMTADRRASLIAVAERHHTWIIEDDAPGPLVDRTLASFAESAPDRTLWLASVAQSLGFGFRLAFARVPAELETKMQQALRALAWTGGTPGGLLAARGLADGTADRVMTERRAAILQRHARVRSVLGNDRCVVTPGIPYVWFHTPRGWRTEALHAALEASGVAAAPAAQFAVDPSRALRGFRFSAAALLDLEEYERALARILDVCTHPGRYRSTSSHAKGALQPKMR